METALTLLGYNLTYFELIGSIFYLGSVILATKASWYNWILSIIGQTFLFFLFWNSNLYINALLQIYFTYICIIAIIYWKKTDKNEHQGLKWLTNKQRLIWGILTITSIFILNIIIKEIIPSSKLSENLFLDILVTVLSVVGVNLLSLKYIDSWVIWIITDIICVLLFGITGIYLISFQYVLITGMAIYGLINWINIYKQLKTT